MPVFIFDTNILDALGNKHDRRVDFIYQALEKLQEQLVKKGTSLTVMHDTPLSAFKKIVSKHRVASVYTNHDYEPYAIARDKETGDFLATQKIAFHTFKDQVIFEKNEVLKSDGTPYTVFTPYSRVWKAKLDRFYSKSYPTEKYFSGFLQMPPVPLPPLNKLGFEKTEITFHSPALDKAVIRDYENTRNILSLRGTSGLSVHLRFGTVSIRHLVQQALKLNEQWLNELIWREFFMSILFHFPDVVQHAFKKKYGRIHWRNNEREFELWCKGETGYPVVDAGMRELNETGLMHNRARMIVASFLTKHLLIDWRWGEAYFAEKLLDYELSSNNGNWQWAAGCGCDAAPYFRIFNPEEQTKRFDPDFSYIKKWVKEFEELSYSAPVVEHKFARERALKVYKAAVQEG